MLSLHHICSHLLRSEDQISCDDAQQILHVIRHTAIHVIISLGVPQKQRVSSIVALQCKETESGCSHTIMVDLYVTQFPNKTKTACMFCAQVTRLHPCYRACPGQAG